MAQTGRPTLTKRQLEAKRRQRKEQKDVRRAQRKAERRERPQGQEGQSSGADPDLEGIVAGPQPRKF